MSLSFYNPFTILWDWGWGFTQADLLDLVEDYVVASGIQSPFTNERPGLKWFYCFMPCHLKLTIRTSEQFPVATARASADTGIFTHWFELLIKTIDHTDVTTKPQNTYNVDLSLMCP